jgi:hypothetical protein
MTETQAQAFDLMQEFYLSRYYEPKAERPADNVQAAIEFTLDRIAALSQPAPTIQPSATEGLAGTAPNLCAAFRTTATFNGRCEMTFHFDNVEALQADDREWHALRAQPSIEAVEAVRAYCAEQDEDNWCQRLRYGRCSLRKCNVEGGWSPGSPADYSKATCARYRVEQSLAALQSSADAGNEHLKRENGNG